MIYCIADASYPMNYISSGNLVSENHFVHPKRNIDSFVLILVIEGTLHITQAQSQYTVLENEFVLLLPNTVHYGHMPSNGHLSYYWVHFYIRDPNYSLYTRRILLRNEALFHSELGLASPFQLDKLNSFLIPEYGRISFAKRSHLLFAQLLDISKRDNYSATWRCHYALSILLLEVTHEAFQINDFIDTNIPMPVLDIIEWIRTHYNMPLSVASIAEKFNYHPTYLSRMFKKHTGLPVLEYINQTRLSIAKNLLINHALTIYEISKMCGFGDKKHFMKLFKKSESMTPTQYRRAFHQKKINLT